MSIGSLDTMIAAHALSQNAMLVTNNTREFSKVSSLQLDNWTTGQLDNWTTGRLGGCSRIGCHTFR